MPREKNPYLDLGLADLSDQAERMAADLLAARVRTSEERRALARNCAFLLLALGRSVRPGYHVDLAPEFRIERHQVAASFGAWLDRERMATRMLMIRRAGEFLGLSPGFEVPAGTFASDEAAIAAIERLAAKK